MSVLIKDYIPYGLYVSGENISLENIQNLSFYLIIKDVNKKLSDQEIEILRINKREDGFNEKLKIIEIKNNFVVINDKGNIETYFLNDWDYSICVIKDDKEHILDINYLISIIKNKDVKYIDEILNQTKVITGEFFQFGKKSLKEYYFNSEENFKKIKSLIIDGEYYLPNEEEELKKIKDFVDEREPGSGEFILSSLKRRIN